MLKNLFFDEKDLRCLKTTDDGRLAEFRDEAFEKGSDAGDMLLLGLIYRCTGNKGCLERARSIMFDRVDNGRWISSDYDPKKYFGFDIRTSLETAFQCRDMAYGLSIFGNDLTDQDRDYLIENTYKKGVLPIMEEWVLPGTRIHALDTMGHNFWMAIISSAALALTVIKDHVKDGDRLLDSAVYAVRSWFLYKGNPMNSKPKTMDNGGYYEGVSYFDFSLTEYLRFAGAYLRLTGKHPFDDSDILADAGRFAVNTSYMSDRKDYFSGFGDSGPDNTYIFCPLFLAYYGMATPELRWYIQTRLDQKSEAAYRILAWKEVWDKPAHEPDELSAFYGGIGWAIFRDSWKKNSTMLAVKCGDTWNHAHEDAGSFILFRGGRPEICDSMVKDYSDPLYIGYFVDSKAHNVVLFNGKGQDFRDNYKNHAHVPGRLLNFTDDRWFRYVCADATGPMGRWFRKHHRHFLWLDKVILIYDDIECYETGEVNFLIHPGKNHNFTMLSPHTEKIMTGYAPEDYSERPYLSFNADTDGEGHAKFAGVITLDGYILPKFEEITMGWKITAGDTTIYINHRADGKVMHRNCINIMDGITTDAEILVCMNGGFAVVNGSIVRKDGISYLDVLARITGLCDKNLR